MSALTFQPLSLSVLIISFKCKFTNIKLFSDGQINTVAYTACLSARPRQDRAQDVEQFVCGRGDEAGRRTHTCTHTQFKYENISGNCFKHANRELVPLRFYCTSPILIWLVFDGEVMNFSRPAMFLVLLFCDLQSSVFLCISAHELEWKQSVRSCSIFGGFTEILMVPAAAAVAQRSICQSALQHSNLTLFPSNRRYTQKSQSHRGSRITGKCWKFYSLTVQV